MNRMDTERTVHEVARFLESEYQWPEIGYRDWCSVAGDVLTHLGLYDLDAAAHRANIDHPHTGLQIGTDCARAVLEAALCATDGDDA